MKLLSKLNLGLGAPLRVGQAHSRVLHHLDLELKLDIDVLLVGLLLNMLLNPLLIAPHLNMDHKLIHLYIPEPTLLHTMYTLTSVTSFYAAYFVA